MSWRIAASIVTGITYFFMAIKFLLIAYVLLSWITRPYNRLYLLVSRLVYPFVAPFKPLAGRLIERGFLIDLSVPMAYIFIRLLEWLIPTLLYRLVVLL